MTIHHQLHPAALDPARLRWLVARIPTERRRGKPWSRSQRLRILITCAALRTNLTIREIAAVFGRSKSAARRIVAKTTTLLAGIEHLGLRDKRWSWIVDGTLIPTRDHR